MPLLHPLEQEVSRLVKAICADFMELNYMRAADPFSIDPKDTEQSLPLTKINIGPMAADTPQSIIADLGERYNDVQLFLSVCKTFLVECVQQVQS